MQFRRKSRSIQLLVTVQGNKAKLWDSRPLAAKPTTKYHISVVFSIKLPLELIWLKVSSAFNLGQRQQWNFPSLSCGA